jgi:signal transduction histidine kinase
MVERSRLEALTADRAKSDFISSVSHEPRSPLHGVLASAEALQETSTGFVQDDLIRTFTVCGEVLLDTMDQILEYAKISNQKPTKTGGEVQSKPETQFSQATPLDLSRLVETVVEGILAGHYQKVALDQQTIVQGGTTHKDSATFSSPSGHIIVILSIDWQDS